MLLSASELNRKKSEPPDNCGRELEAGSINIMVGLDNKQYYSNFGTEYP